MEVKTKEVKTDVKVTVRIKAPAAKVWEALTKPELVKQYLFGTEVISDWKPGSPIRYRGIWEGKAYEDKGTILEIEPEKRMVSTYWSSMSGLPDSVENYKTIRYELFSGDGKTILALTQDNNRTPEEAAHSRRNWAMVLCDLKKIVERE